MYEERCETKEEEHFCEYCERNGITEKEAECLYKGLPACMDCVRNFTNKRAQIKQSRSKERDTNPTKTKNPLLIMSQRKPSTRRSHLQIEGAGTVRTGGSVHRHSKTGEQILHNNPLMSQIHGNSQSIIESTGTRRQTMMHGRPRGMKLSNEFAHLLPRKSIIPQLPSQQPLVRGQLDTQESDENNINPGVYSNVSLISPASPGEPATEGNIQQAKVRSFVEPTNKVLNLQPQGSAPTNKGHKKQTGSWGEFNQPELIKNIEESNALMHQLQSSKWSKKLHHSRKKHSKNPGRMLGSAPNSPGGTNLFKAMNSSVAAASGSVIGGGYGNIMRERHRSVNKTPEGGGGGILAGYIGGLSKHRHKHHGEVKRSRGPSSSGGKTHSTSSSFGNGGSSGLSTSIEKLARPMRSGVHYSTGSGSHQKAYQIGKYKREEIHNFLYDALIGGKIARYDSEILFQKELATEDIPKVDGEELHLACDGKGSFIFVLQGTGLGGPFYVGGFSEIGWMDDFPYLHDKNCGCFMVCENSIYICEFENDIVNNSKEEISFGYDGTSFKFPLYGATVESITLQRLLVKIASNSGQERGNITILNEIEFARFTIYGNIF